MGGNEDQYKYLLKGNHTSTGYYLCQHWNNDLNNKQVEQ